MTQAAQETETDLSEDLLAYIRNTPSTTASTLITDYVRDRQSADQNAVRRAMMKLMSSGKITVGAGPVWAISVRPDSHRR